MAAPTFRDFAGAVMSGDATAAATVLESLLGLPAPAAAAATAHFRAAMATGGPEFMGKAMGLRTAVTSGTDDDIARLLGDCFGLDAVHRATGTAALRRA